MKQLLPLIRFSFFSRLPLCRAGRGVNLQEAQATVDAALNGGILWLDAGRLEPVWSKGWGWLCEGRAELTQQRVVSGREDRSAWMEWVDSQMPAYSAADRA
jgi:hypothetical protein